MSSNRRVRQGTETAYVAAVGVITFLATQHPNHFRRNWWIAALLLCLPAMIAVLPVLYVAGAAAWNISGADHGGAGWPVTTTYVAVLILAAVANVVFVRWWNRRHSPDRGGLESAGE